MSVEPNSAHFSPATEIERTMERIKKHKVVAVLRGGHPDRLILRGLELASMKG